MNAHTMLSGETIEYPDPAPAVAAFLTRARLAAEDPTVSVSQFIELVYSPANPLLDTTILPGRAMVTRAVFADPVYHVLADLVGRKQVQAGLLDPAADAARYTVSVPDAAARLGITPASVRAAINAKKLAGRQANGQWWVSEESLASYKVSNRGRRAAGTPRVSRSDAGPRAAGAVRVRAGGDPVGSLSVRVAGAELVRTGGGGGVVEGELPAGWTRAVVKTTSSDGVRAFVIEPAPEDADITHGMMYVRGPFTVVERVNNTRKANDVWRAAAPATA